MEAAAKQTVEMLGQAYRKFEQGSSEWLKWRQSGIGASEVFILACFARELGFDEPSPRPIASIPAWVDTPLTLYRRKLGLAPEFGGNVHTQRGKQLEPRLRAAFNETFQVGLEPVCIDIRRTPYNISLDGLCVQGPGVISLEIKAPSRHWPQPPEYVIHQCAYQRAVVAMAVHGAPIRAGVLAGYESGEADAGTLGTKYVLGNLGFDVFDANDLQPLGEWLLALVGFFWGRYIKPGKEPPAVAGDVEVRTDDAFQAAAAAYRKAWQLQDEAKKAIARTKKVLVGLAGEFTGAVSGYGVRLTNVTRRGSVDYDAILAKLAPEFDVEPFRKDASSSVTITVEKADLRKAA